jgi:hypothetical protein
MSGVDLAFQARQAEACQYLEKFCIEKGFNELKPKVRTTKQE